MAKVTWDAVNIGVGVVLSNGNLTAIVPDGNTARASLARTTGKWYWEIKVDAVGFINIGIINSLASLTAANYNTQNARYYRATQRKLPDNVQYGSTYTTNDVVGVAMDLDGGTLAFYKNGVSQGISHTNIKTMGEVFPAVTNHSTTANTSTVNFGETPFSHPIPEGFQAYQPPAISKSFLLFGDEYKKYDEGSPAIQLDVNAIPIMTSNTTPSGTASASSYLVGGEPWKAFNGIYTGSSVEAWIANAITGWLSYRFDVPKIIKSYRFRGRNDTNLQMNPANWTLDGSNDGIAWDILHSGSKNWTGYSGEWISNQLTVNKPYVLYRINITKNNGNTLYTCVSELQLIEEVATSFVPPSWEIVSSTLPTLPQFQSEGMDDFSIFDRKVQQVIESPQAMTISVLGVGKVFKGVVNLNKYFDLRKLEVK